MHALFVEPSFPANQRQFVRALSEVGVRVTGIGEAPAQGLPADVRRALDGYEQVGSVCDEQAMLAAVRRIQARGWVDRMEATVEAHIMPAARVREAAQIPGTTTRTAWLCRDKPSMKQALRDAGIPCAQSAAVESTAAAIEFARRVGYPLILKPRAGAGASGAERVDDEAQLRAAAERHHLDRGASVAIEEFIEGHEGFFDALVVSGRVVHCFISHYYPGVLEAMRTRWISPYLITTNRVDSSGYDEVKAMGQRVIDALGIWNSAVHMEWFFGPKGLKFSEIGCRPPGVGVWDLYCAANEFDLYRDWASAVTWERTEQRPSRKYSAGLLALRPDQDGTISGYEGRDEMFREYGSLIIDAHFPNPGSPTQGVEAGYMANAWVRVRHPDYDTLRNVLDAIGRTVKVRAR